MTKVIVGLKLKADADRDAFESWAVGVDRPTVTGYGSVDDWHLYRVAGQLQTDDPAPCDYIEVTDLNDLGQLRHDLRSDAHVAATEHLFTFLESGMALRASEGTLTTR